MKQRTSTHTDVDAHTCSYINMYILSSKACTHRLWTHCARVCTHTYTLWTHCELTHIHCGHTQTMGTLCTHTLNTYTIDTLCTHTVGTDTHRLWTYCAHAHTHTVDTHTLWTHTLWAHCGHTQAVDTLCTHTLCTHTHCGKTHILWTCQTDTQFCALDGGWHSAVECLLSEILDSLPRPTCL